MPRYDDQPEYGRPRDAIRGNTGRDVRRAIDPSERNRAVERDYPDDHPMDMRIDQRPEARTANTGTRVERPPVRGIETRGDRGDVFYRDPRTGELYRDVPNRRTPYEDEFENLPQSSRPIIVSAPDPGQTTRASYAEYFLPGEGIEREVIQAEICRYLGQDATCRPGRDQEGRSGFVIKAYRAPTSEMIRSLRESSSKFRNEEKYWADKEKLRRRPEVVYAPIQDQYDRDMDIDDDNRDPRENRNFIPPGRYPRDVDPRDPRNTLGSRHIPGPPLPPVTSAYMADPGYPAYSISTVPTSNNPPIGYEPRTFNPSGNTPPPAPFRSTGFPSMDGPPRTTQPPSATMAAPSYQDPRTGKVVNTYSNYPTDTRHRGR